MPKGKPERYGATGLPLPKRKRHNVHRKRGEPSHAPKYIAEHQELVEAIRAVWNKTATQSQRDMVNEWVDRRVREELELPDRSDTYRHSA